MIIHRRIPRRAALLLGFVWPQAGVLALAFVVGPLLLGVLEGIATIEDGDDLAGVIRNTGEYYRDVITFEWFSSGFWDGPWGLILAILGGWGLLQVVFLSPLIGPPRIDGEGRSMAPSVITAAIIATTGSAIAWVAIVEAVFALMVEDSSGWNSSYDLVVYNGWIPAMAIWIIGGFVWYRGLRRAGAAHDPAGLDRLLRRLLAGTAIETALGTLAILMVRRRSDCICATGSFLSLAYSLFVLVWLCGPWTVLLTTRRERSRWARRACGHCGYVRRAGTKRCSECGEAWPEEIMSGDDSGASATSS
ncbi:MAG: hypothetical protein CMJ34_08275 [Phycisphaerae bacterium]|nr:hypothetical protein [Phycisphaerae bacterium]